MVRRWTECPGDQRGATAVEYGVLVACLALALVVVVAAVGDALVGKFTHVESPIASAGS